MRHLKREVYTAVCRFVPSGLPAGVARSTTGQRASVAHRKRVAHQDIEPSHRRNPQSGPDCSVRRRGGTHPSMSRAVPSAYKPWASDSVEFRRFRPASACPHVIASMSAATLPARRLLMIPVACALGLSGVQSGTGLQVGVTQQGASTLGRTTVSGTCCTRA